MSNRDEAMRVLDADLEVAAKEALDEALVPSSQMPAYAAGLGPALADAESSNGPFGEYRQTIEGLTKRWRLIRAGASADEPASDIKERGRDLIQNDLDTASQAGRRRWVYTSGGQPLAEPVEVSDDWRNTDREPSKTSEEEIYGHLRATDGTVLDTRAKHRRYMKERGLTLQSDYTQHLEKAANERGRAFTDPSYDRTRRLEAVRLAVELHDRRRRK